jgi:hypothetical protein
MVMHHAQSEKESCETDQQVYKGRSVYERLR